VVPSPGGGGTAEGSIEDGLKNLVKFAGPNVRELSIRADKGYQAILDAAHVPDDWTVDAKASAVLTVIQELIDEIRNANWRLAARAAFRVPATDYVAAGNDSREGRWKTLAHQERVLAEQKGSSGPQDIKKQVEHYRDYWRSAVPQLALDLKRRLDDLNRTLGAWDRYGTEPPLSPASPLPMAPPISFDRTEVLYEFRGTVGIQATSHRWLRAHEPVDHYDAVGWYYNEPTAGVEITPLANCTSEGPLHELPKGGVLGRLTFSHTLEPDEQYYFAYITRFNSGQPCRPTILYEVRGREIRNLTVRAVFDIHAVPQRICYFDVGAQDDGWEWPEDDAPQWLPVAANGFVEHTFAVCLRGRQYGLKWQWPEQASH